MLSGWEVATCPIHHENLHMCTWSYSGHVTSLGLWTLKHIPQGSYWEVFKSSWWKSNGRKLFFGQNWWSPENIHNSMVNYVSGCWISYNAQILSLGLKNTYFKCNMVCPFVPKLWQQTGWNLHYRWTLFSVPTSEAISICVFLHFQ